MILGAIKWDGGPTSPLYSEDARWGWLQPERGVRFATFSRFRSSTYSSPEPKGEAGGVSVALSGRFWATGEAETEGSAPRAGSRGALVADLYRSYGSDFPSYLRGTFAIALWDSDSRRFLLARDRLGVEPLFYATDGACLTFGSSTPDLIRLLGRRPTLRIPSLAKILIFDYNPGGETVFEGVRRLRPGRVLVADEGGSREHRYWRLSFPIEPNHADERQVIHQLRSHLETAVARQIDPDVAPTVFVSGGMDSSTVLEFAKRRNRNGIRTFSYRCRGESFDESHYAEIMARSAGSSHHLAEYTPESVRLMPEIVAEMSEPFCELGINVATYLLGREASPRSPYVLTGDGGDELFGGHPVYEADKVARFADWIPSSIRDPVLALAARLPDSDRKKDLLVKVKRFAEALTVPRDLGTHRWRTYYAPVGLNGLFEPDVAKELGGHDLYADIRALNQEADGPDMLSRSLYSDYFTQVDFCLRRNDLNRGLGLETRYPLLDVDLVEYCASLPSHLKIRGWFETKYILHRAMDGLLPDEIVHRDDKLGHSIPLKNWIRDDDSVREFVFDFTGEAAVRRRGLFRPEAVQRMVEEHMSRRRNNSHRLWTLAVVEMWLQAQDRVDW